MRVLIFHGYLLSGTGSNVYNARLSEALARLGHEVHLFCQDRHPDLQPFVGAAGDWDAGWLQVRTLRHSDSAHRDSSAPSGARARCTVYRPDIGGLLPVYVTDRYEGIEARSFLECSDDEVADYVRANIQAVREVAAQVRPQVALANHLVMGPVILARALEGAVPYAVKVHGSALEYTVKRDRARFLSAAREGLGGANTILVGSRHTAESLWAALDDPSLEGRTRLGPPGVDVERFAPREPDDAAAGLRALAFRLRESAAMQHRLDATQRESAASEPEGASDSLSPGAAVAVDEQASTFARDERAAADAVERLASGSGELVAFVGKLLAAKGIDLLLAAWPLVLQQRALARLVVVGFGGWREEVEGLCRALAAGELRGVEARALPHVRAFLRGLDERARQRYTQAARRLTEQVVFTGRLDHEELAELLPACEALVVPSTFPEAFGMVAAEAAACGVLPVSARHSGLAEVSDALARAVPGPAAGWLSFPVDDGSVQAIADRLVAWLRADGELRSRVRAGLVDVVRNRWSWEGVACGVIAAARGELASLEVPR